MNITKRRSARLFAAFATAAVAATAFALPPTAASAAEATGWEQNLVLLGGDTGAALSPARGGLLCVNQGSELHLTVTGAPNETFDVSFTPAFERGLLSSDLVDLESWNETRDTALEQNRLDAVDDIVEAEAAVAEPEQAWNTVYDSVREAKNAPELADAHSALGLAQQIDGYESDELAAFANGASSFKTEQQIESAYDALRETAGVTTTADAQTAVNTLEAEIAELEATADDLNIDYQNARTAVTDAEAAERDAARDLAEHIYDTADVNEWAVTADSDGAATLTLIGCGVSGDLTITDADGGTTTLDVTNNFRNNQDGTGLTAAPGTTAAFTYAADQWSLDGGWTIYRAHTLNVTTN